MINFTMPFNNIFLKIDIFLFYFNIFFNFVVQKTLKLSSNIFVKIKLLLSV